MSVRIATVAFSAAALLAAPAFGDGHVCRGEAGGGHGNSTVGVSFTVDASGAVIDRSADWSPPTVGTRAALFAGQPTLVITYSQPSEAGLGPATAIVGHAISNQGTKPWRGAMLSLTLDGDSAQTWSVNFLALSPGHPKRGEPEVAVAIGVLAEADGAQGPLNIDLLTAVERAKTARLGLRVGDHLAGGVTNLELSGHAERDRRFAQAWAEAVKAAQHPQACSASG